MTVINIPRHFCLSLPLWENNPLFRQTEAALHTYMTFTTLTVLFKGFVTGWNNNNLCVNNTLHLQCTVSQTPRCSIWVICLRGLGCISVRVSVRNLPLPCPRRLWSRRNPLWQLCCFLHSRAPIWRFTTDLSRFCFLVHSFSEHLF